MYPISSIRDTKSGAPPTVLSGLLDLFKQELLCDVSISSGDGVEIPTHRVVLAASSQYFKALLTGPWSTALHEQQPLKLDHFNGEVLRTAIQALYLSSEQTMDLLWRVCRDPVDGPPASPCFNPSVRSQPLLLPKMEELLQLGNFLGAPVLQHNVEQYVMSHARDLEFQIIAMAARVDSVALQEWMIGLAALNFPNIMLVDEDHGVSARAKDVAELSTDLMHRLLTSKHMDASARSMLMAIDLWLQGNPEGRAAEIPGLVDTVQLAPEELLSLVEGLVTTCDHPAAIQAFQAVAADLRRVVTQNAALPSSQPECENFLLAIGGRDAAWLSIRLTEGYDPRSDTWSLSKTLPCDMPFAGSAAGGRGLCRQVVAVGGATWKTSVCCYGYGEVKEYDIGWRCWQQRSAMQVPRLHSAMASLWDVYVMGGRTMTDHNCSIEVGSMERYSVANNVWTPVADMPQPRQCHAAVALSGRIFAVGGQAGRRTFAGTDSYDPGSDTWCSLGAEMRSERKYLALAAHDGRIFAIGGMNGQRKRLASVEALDPREGRWHSLPTISSPRSSCGVASLGSQLFVVGGTSSLDEQPLATVEAFVSEAGKWMPKASLQMPRTGHTVAPVL